MSTKTWTSKVDWDGGVYDKLYCPIGLAQLEIAYNELSGKATYIFDGGAGKKFNWAAFGHSKENTKIIWRDDFRANSISKYTWHNFPGWNNESPVMPGYDSANKRLTIDTGGGNGTTLEIPGLSVQNAKASMDVYVYGYYPTNASVGQWLRLVNNGNYYVTIHQSTLAGAVYETAIGKRINTAWTTLAGGGTADPSLRFPGNAWRTLVFRISGNNLNAYTNEYNISATDGSFTAANKVLMGLWQSKGYIGAVLVEHYSLPSPAGTSVSFKFWGGNDGGNWGCEHSDIKDVPHSRYIKIEVTMTRQSLAKAMPVLKDMTLTYYQMKPQPIFI